MQSVISWFMANGIQLIALWKILDVMLAANPKIKANSIFEAIEGILNGLAAPKVP